MERAKLFLLCVVVISLYGCASFTAPARHHVLEEGRTYWLDYDATRRGTIVIPKYEKKNVAICSEPAPDAALNIIDRFKANVGTGKVTVGVEADIEEKVIQLAKRSQTILFLREALYRLCELSLNYHLNEDEVRKLYEKVLNAATDMAAAELTNAQQSKIEADTRKLEIMKNTPGFIDEYIKSLKNK